jgi:hypothetical protein
MRAEESAECFVDCLDRESAMESPMKSPKSHLSPVISPDLLQFVWEIVCSTGTMEVPRLTVTSIPFLDKSTNMANLDI